MTLTSEQSQAIQVDPEQPHEMTDPATNRRYVLIALDHFARLQEDAEDARYTRGWQTATQRGMALALGDEE